MEPLIEAVIDLVALVSPARVRSICSKVRGNDASGAAAQCRATVDTPAARAVIDRILSEWVHSNTTGDELAGMLIGACEARSRAEREASVELVWTGPTTRFVPTRRTEEVLVDLIQTATHALFLVSFVAYDVRRVSMAMNDAIARGVIVRVLLEASEGHGGTLESDHIARMRRTVPAAELFSWKDRREEFIDGKVHAKVAVVDSTRAFITSANLTSHALEKNMEAGVLVNGGAVPKLLDDHLQALIDVGILVPA